MIGDNPRTRTQRTYPETDMNPEGMTAYLHQGIPLTAAMGIEVIEAQPHCMIVRAPLAPNINHHQTAFGGSLVTLGIIAAWSLVHFGLCDAGLESALVIQKSECEYLRPVTEGLIAQATTDDTEWCRFVAQMVRKRRARIAIETRLRSGGAEALRHRGTFVAQR